MKPPKKTIARHTYLDQELDDAVVAYCTREGLGIALFLRLAVIEKLKRAKFTSR